ncbi:nudix hydrolase 2-like isoform X1 [Olea europaea subsp. europaea]|uniref:Nudix hydrolase 2-like isoform X1 n=1 Tax=Olea europaea subsp. europaea TaxID=158383 RepID=A0A8S0U975_OLEEU|nr:nudix hydrolase 2-like isoform X1 [Olea europaea subsp. europaea]
MSSSDSPLPSEKQADRILEAINDDYGGVVVEMTNEPMDAHIFVSLLRASLSHWRQLGKKGVWIKMPIELVNLVEPAVKEGFYCHHAESRYLMLVHWLPSTPNTLPANASHRVGVSAFVMNEKNEVLVVQEKDGKLQGTGLWKFPTGVVDEVGAGDQSYVIFNGEKMTKETAFMWLYKLTFFHPQGEDICDAAVREIKEETGIDSEFVEILAFRQSHKSFFEKSDLFFVCMLQPLSFDIRPQEAEIEAAQWMPFEEYTAQPFVQEHEFQRYIADVCLAKKDEGYSGFSPVPMVSDFSLPKSYLYLNQQDLDI